MKHERQHRPRMTPEARAVIERIRANWRADEPVSPRSETAAERAERDRIRRLRWKLKRMNTPARRQRMRPRKG
jgi:hypothetical protein